MAELNFENSRVLPSLSGIEEEKSNQKSYPTKKSRRKRNEAKSEQNSTKLESDKTELIKKDSKEDKNHYLNGEDNDRKTSLKEGSEDVVPEKTNTKKNRNKKEGWKENKKKENKSARNKKTSKGDDDDDAEAEPEGKAEDIFVDDGHVMQVVVHRSDRLKFNELMSHPVVCVSLVDANTESYVKKSDRNRPVISRYENANESLDYIQPVLTLPFDFKHNQSITPVWEDSIIINEAFNHLIRPEAKVIVLFQLKDFVGAQHVNSRRQQQQQQLQQGWFTIAWAFLQLVGSDGSANWGGKVRLQLYKVPGVISSKNNQAPEVFQWWSSGQRTAYSSTLHVTINKVKVISEVTPSLRSFFPLQEEGIVQPTDQYRCSLAPSHSDHLGDPIAHLTTWSRLPGQACQIPKTLCKVLPSAAKGCSCIKFSKNGRLMACGCHEVDSFPLFVYEVPSFHHLMTLKGHQGIIYDICWTRDDKHVVTASADGTVRIWSIDMKDSKASAFLPSFLYTARIEPVGNEIAVTGGYDKLIRIWAVRFSGDRDGSESCSIRQLQELSLHTSHINVVSFHPDGKTFFSGDASGSLMAWTLDVDGNPNAPASFKKEIKVDGTKGVAITSLDVHPLGHKILVHSKNNKIQIIDLRVEATLHKLLGPMSIRSKLKSCFSSDGSLVFSGSEDGRVYIWSSESGNQLSIYGDLNYNAPICGLDLHPLDDYVAFCCHERRQPIRVYKYDQSDPASQKLPREGWKESLEANAMMSTESKSNVLTVAKSSLNDFDFLHSMRIHSIKSKLLEVNSMHASTFSYSASFQGAPSMSSSLVLNAPKLSNQPILTINAENDKEVKVVFKSPSTVSKEIVIATEDYTAQRSDELSFSKGDIIITLHKDSDTWWMGYMPATTKQGFFPANRVVSKTKSSAVSINSKIESSVEGVSNSDSKTASDARKSDDVKYGSLLREKPPRGNSRRSSMPNRVSFNLDESMSAKVSSREVAASKDPLVPSISSSLSTARRGSKNFQNLNPIPEDAQVDLTDGKSMHEANDRIRLSTDNNKRPSSLGQINSARRNSLTSQRLSPGS